MILIVAYDSKSGEIKEVCSKRVAAVELIYRGNAKIKNTSVALSQKAPKLVAGSHIRFPAYIGTVKSFDPDCQTLTITPSSKMSKEAVTVIYNEVKEEVFTDEEKRTFFENVKGKYTPAEIDTLVISSDSEKGFDFHEYEVNLTTKRLMKKAHADHFKYEN